MGKRIFKNISYLWDIFLNTIYPKEYICLSCGEYSEEGLCRKCKREIKLVKDSYIEDYLRINSLCYYKGTIKSLILEFKYHNDYNCGDYMANLLIDNFESIIKQSDIITYVPLTKKKKRQRGFNQCEFIAQCIGKSFDMEVEKLLLKKINNKEQKTLDSKSRIENVRNVYEYNNRINLKDKNILLIDDVITTGATVRECSKILLNNGAKFIQVITIAKSNIEIIT